jgi:hypothetical protein
MRKTMRITKRQRDETRTFDELAGLTTTPAAASPKYALIITERNAARRKPIRSTTRYGEEHAERICRQRSTQSYNYAMTVVA